MHRVTKAMSPSNLSGLKGMGRLKALRAAQLAMLAKNRMENEGNGLPPTWGAFVLSGEWR